ncbi:unnamed protein product [Caretta caretta]
MTGLVLREPELRLVLSAYADDVLLVVQDPGDLARVEACQAIYLAASSARVNWVKSSGLAVGDWRQEKAFDRVDHGYLLSTLQAFGFGPQFVSFLRVLYASAECLVRLNWTLTEPVSFGRGVRQGCPLSGQLYALAIEPFLCLLRRRMTGLVLREPELRLVLSAYADDVLPRGPGPGRLGASGGMPSHLFGSLLRPSQLGQELWLGGGGLAAGKLPPTRTSDHPVECGSTALSRRLPFRHASFPAGELAKFRGRGDRADPEMDEATPMSLPPRESTGA